MGKFIRWLLGTAAPVATPTVAVDLWPKLPDGHPAEPARHISAVALAEAEGAYGKALNAWTLPDVPPFMPAAAAPAMAMDDAYSPSAVYNWASNGMFNEGIGFLGYAYLGELSQRPEYRRVSEIFAAEATRGWIKLTGDQARIDKIEAAMKKHDVRAVIRRLVELDGFFGRGQLYIDLGDDADAPELQTPLVPAAKIRPNSIKRFKIIEPFWSYPGLFDSRNPLDPDFYRPRFWYIMTSLVDSSRLITIASREMPDMLKPAYSFGGLSLSQMIKPYVDNWLRTRQSVSDLLHSFSTMVLSTDMGTVLQSGPATGLLSRIKLFAATRDNRGVMVVNKESEELTNVSAPLGTLDKLQAQSQEQIASACGIPLVILLGVTPSGLNASSDGEIRAFYDNVKSWQERALRTPLHKIIDLLQLDLDGKIDPDISFEFNALWEMSETDKASVRKTDAEIDSIYVGVGVVDNAEVRERITNDEQSPYHGMKLQGNDDLNAPPPSPAELAAAKGADNPDANAPPGTPKRKAANDSFSWNPYDLVGLAMDEQHWITVHPHGDDDGQPVLIEGNGSGGYTIVGGAGGKLNGKTVHPGSMSGAKGGGHATHEEATHAARVASNHAIDKGTSEAHEAAAEAHATAKEHARVAGEHGKAEEHGKSFAEHKAIAAKLAGPAQGPRSKAADDESKYADEHNTEWAHWSAAAAHEEAAQEAARNLTGAAPHERDKTELDRHKAKASEHVAKAEALAEEAQKGKSDATVKAEEATAHAGKNDNASAHNEAAMLHMTAKRLATEAGKSDQAEKHARMQRYHTTKRDEHEQNERHELLTGGTETANASSTEANEKNTSAAHELAASTNRAIANEYRAAAQQLGASHPMFAPYMKAAAQHGGNAAGHERLEQMASLNERVAAQKAAVKGFKTTDAGKAIAKTEKRFASKPAAQIQEDFARFGLQFANGSNAKREYAKAKAAYSKNYGKQTPEERIEARKALSLAHSAKYKTNSALVSGHTEYDVDDGTAGARAARRTIGHVYNALEHLDKQGFDIKSALDRASVAFQPAQTRDANGHAFQRGGTGYFSLSTTARTTEGLIRQKANHDQRIAYGHGIWSQSMNAAPEDMAMTTAIHELAHALGKQPHINSPAKLSAILREHYPDEKERHAFIKNNISEYATENISETDAELAALITSKGYKRGTLPKAFEDHIDELFAHKSRLAPAA